LGAGDAVKSALPLLREVGCRDFLVVYADMPLWRPETISALVLEHLREMPAITMATVALDSKAALRSYGRILRNEQGKIIGVVEPADATEEQLRTTTVNPSLYVFRREWFAENIGRVRPRERGDGYPPEIYLPPLVALAHEQGQRVAEFPIQDPTETLGVNTLAELLAVRQIVGQ
jgi:bifunctional UDP-N-acetylglucosamine pyrophosphorylase/glucosamine-1-phosphate N-acetyltransferase